MKPKIGLVILLLTGALPLASIAVDDGEPPPPTESTPGQYIDDVTITMKVKAAFIEDKDVRALDISVRTDDGVVKLSGVTSSVKAVTRAVEIAGSVKGVKLVKIDLELKVR